MDGQSSQSLSPTRSASSWLDRDAPWLIALLVIVAILRCWLIVNTEVTARDSIGFIRYSLLFDRMSWSEALCSQHQHPGYPVVVWLVAKPLRAAFGTTPEVMRIAAQLVSLISSLLLAVMMFRLGRHLWDRHVGMFAALMFQCFPISGHHLSDGISDGLFLLITISALDTLIRARESGGLGRYAIGGTLIGLAYLTRPEGLLVLPAAWLFLLGLQFTKHEKQPWGHVAVRLTTLTLCCALAGAPYFVATGKITIKPSVMQTLGDTQAAWLERDDRPLFASLFGSTFTRSNEAHEQLRRTMRALIFELGQALNYIGGIFAVWALVFCRKTLTRNVGFYLLALYFAIHVAILVKLGLTVSYVSDRHVMALVALTCYPCVVGLTHLNSPWARWISWGRATAAGDVFPRVVEVAAGFWLLFAIAICAGKTTTRLHANRAGNHQAGLWLAEHAHPGDLIEDDHNWSHYYAGHMFLEGREPTLHADILPNHFCVMTRSKDDGVREKRESQEEDWKKANAKMVYHWPTNVDPAKARIVVYARPRQFETHPWARSGPPSPPGVFVPVSQQK